MIVNTNPNKCKGYITCYDPKTLETKMVSDADQIPEGWQTGAPKASTWRYENIETGEIIYDEPDMEIQGFRHSPIMKGRKYFTNPDTGESRAFVPGEQPSGWLNFNNNQKGIRRTAGRKWYKSPCETMNKMCYEGTQPEGWIPGRVRAS